MEKTLTDADIKNLLALINLAPIKGNEAVTVAILQQKLTGMLTPEASAEAASMAAPSTAVPAKKK